MSAQHHHEPASVFSDGRDTHFKVPTSLLIWAKALYDWLELVHRHLGKVVVVDECAASGLVASDDVAAGRFNARLAIYAVPEVEF